MDSDLPFLQQLRGFMATRWYIAGRAELIAHGFPWTSRSWVRGGRLITVVRGVYLFGRDIETREAAWRVALVAAGQGSVLAGRTACEIWGMVSSEDRIPRLIEAIRHQGDPARLRGLSPAMKGTLIRIYRRQLEPSEIRRKAGFELTSPVRSLIDFAVHASETEVLFAFLEACRLQLFNRSDVDDCFKRVAGRRGATKLNPLLALWVPELVRIRSVLEGLFLLAWVEAGQVMPQVNVKIHGFEVDFYWPAFGVVLELDGNAFHSDPVARRRDVEKMRALEARGLRVIRITFKEMWETPKLVVHRVVAVLMEAKREKLAIIAN